jgi:hypothetical protein
MPLSELASDRAAALADAPLALCVDLAEVCIAGPGQQCERTYPRRVIAQGVITSIVTVDLS